jgi:hypothetical protein
MGDEILHDYDEDSSEDNKPSLANGSYVARWNNVRTSIGKGATASGSRRGCNAEYAIGVVLIVLDDCEIVEGSCDIALEGQDELTQAEEPRGLLRAKYRIVVTVWVSNMLQDDTTTRGIIDIY